MSHAAVVKDGLFFFVTLLTVLLVLFVFVTVLTSPEVARPPTQPDTEPPPVPAPRPDLDDPTYLDDPAFGWPPRRASWPDEAVDQPAVAGPVVRRATRGGPPWGPAPRPPGLSP